MLNSGNYKKFAVIFVMLALGASLGAYFVIHTRKVAAEQARILKEEQDFKKIEKKIFGYSAQGRAIEGYEIGNGKNVIFLFASLHGDEVGTAELLNRFIEEVKIDPAKISRSKKLVVMPVSNPDAYLIRDDKLNANLVNLNLNFLTSDWKEYGPEGTYAGSQPFSEPESKIIRRVVENYEPKIMISYHAIGALVSPELNEVSIALAHWYADKTGYKYFNEWDYPGTATKWFVEITNNPAITVELTNYEESDWEINKNALLELVHSDEMPL